MKRFGIGIFVVCLTFGLTSCSGDKNSAISSAVNSVGSVENQTGTPIIPVGLKGETEASEKGAVVEIAPGIKTIAYSRNNRSFFVAEGILTSEAFVGQGSDSSIRSSQMKELSKQLSENGVKIIHSDAQIGYFKALIPYKASAPLFHTISETSFKNRFIINPVIYSPSGLGDIRALSKEMNELADVDLARSSNAGFSGLSRIKAPEFVKEVQKEIGEIAVDGSTVLVGITDTGITFNHPSYLSAATKESRVKYMKEFTGEGSQYFSLKAKTEIKSGTNPEDILVSAEILTTPVLPDLPLSDALEQVKDLVFKVTPEQKELLLANKDKVKFGLISEKVMNAKDEPVDLNANKKLDDQFPIFVIPAEKVEDSQILVDFTATGDFRAAGIIGDFNTSKKLISVKAEKVGIHLKSKQLTNSAGDVEEVIAAGIVGYDPGNHGSHVAGIVGGLKTIANDSVDTLARGVAPETQFMMNRVCANNGGCDASEAMIDLAKNGAEVINMSLGGLSPFNDGYSSQDLLVNRLSQLYNTTFVISAGNSGPGRQTIGSPSVARLSMSIGAAASRGLVRRQYQWPASGSSSRVDENEDFMLFFSSRGPTAAGGFKPSLVAPGTELSSIQLNAAPGAKAGLDVYWGTSMSAPTAAGAYALLLDAVKKYNDKFPEKKLPQDALTLKEALIHSARPFDVTRFDPASGEKSVGQYSWSDQGTGMLDLVAAWKKLFQARDEQIAKRENDVGVSLDYSVITSMTAPNGNKYDGSRANPKGDAVFGTGLYLDFADTANLVQVSISRKLPVNLAAKDDGTLARLLNSTAEEFTLKTVYYGSDKEWLKVGTRNQTDCLLSETAPLTIVGTGAEISFDAAGVAKLVRANSSTLNVCIDRLKVRNELTPGDHGALIFAYATRDGKQSPLPSFVVPVYMTVPHQTLAGSTGYVAKRTVKSFGVDRNYIRVPEGTSLVRVTLEVEKPDVVLDRNGQPAAYTNCSGVELMGLEGGNTLKSHADRASARISSCGEDGKIGSAEKMVLPPLVRVNPTPGVWDLNVFGSYMYPESRYTLKVDYVTAVASKKVIVGDMSAISGSLDFTIKETSIPISLEKGLSQYALSGLKNVKEERVKQKETKIVAGPSGELRKYLEGVNAVTIKTGGSPGSDIDLGVLECVDTAKDANDPSCVLVGASGGATDEESVSFIPKKGFAYAMRVDGYEMKGGEAPFQSTEILSMAPEYGNISVSGGEGSFKIDYSFNAEQIEKSKILGLAAILNSTLEKKAYSAEGSITLTSDDGAVLGAVPVELQL